MNKTPIVLCVDDRGIKFINPLIRSIRDNVPTAEIHLITDSQVQLEPVDHRYHFTTPVPISRFDRITPYMWTRCWIDQILPDLKKFIYLDFDCIVTGDISDMLDGDDWIVRAVPYPSRFTFCSGVMAFNFNNPITGKVMEVVRTYAHPSNFDEDVLNIHYSRYVQLLSKDYMVMNLGDITFGKLKPKVIHFYGDMKAWMNPIQYYFKYCKLDEDIIDLTKLIK